jgi:hypothetical protein
LRKEQDYRVAEMVQVAFTVEERVVEKEKPDIKCEVV